MSKERRHISQRKIRRIKRTTDDSTFKIEAEPRVKKPQGLKPNTKLYYTKVIFGIISGAIAGLLFIASAEIIGVWIVILLGGLVICGLFVRYILKIPNEELDQKRLWLSGTFTFVVLFIVVCSLFWMFWATQGITI